MLVAPALAATVDVTQGATCVFTEESDDRTCTLLDKTYSFTPPQYICTGDSTYPGTTAGCWVMTFGNRKFNPGDTQTIGPFAATLDFTAEKSSYTATFSFTLEEQLVTINDISMPQMVGLKSNNTPQVILTSKSSQPLNVILEISTKSGFLSTTQTFDQQITVQPGKNAVFILTDGQATEKLGKIDLTVRTVIVLETGEQFQSGDPVTVSYEVTANTIADYTPSITYDHPGTPLTQEIRDSIAIAGALMLFAGFVLIVMGLRSKRKAKAALVVWGFLLIVAGIGAISIIFFTQQTALSDAYADGYAPYGAGASDLKAYFAVQMNQYGADIEIGVGETRIDASKIPSSSTVSDCSSSYNNIAQGGQVSLTKAANANLQFTIAQMVEGYCYNRNFKSPAGGGSVYFGPSCVLKEPGDYRVDIEINGPNAIVTKGNTQVCTVPKETVPKIDATYGQIHVTDIRIRRPFSCTQMDGEMLGGKVFEAGDTVSALSFPYFVRVCPIHLPIIIDADQQGSDVDFTLYNKLAQGDKLVVPAGQVWVIQYVFDAKAAGVTDVACTEFYNVDKKQCDSLSGYASFLDRGVVDTQDGVNVIVANKDVCFGTIHQPGEVLPDGTVLTEKTCVDYMTPQSQCPVPLLATGECARIIQPKDIILEPKQVCVGAVVNGECIIYEQGKSATCLPGDSIDPIDGLCKGKDTTGQAKQPYPPYDSPESACAALDGDWQDTRCVTSFTVVEQVITIQKEKVITLIGAESDKSDIATGRASLVSVQEPSIAVQVIIGLFLVGTLFTIIVLVSRRRKK